MDCPACNNRSTRVLQTRRESPDSTIRQRICRNCGEEWFTLEIELPKNSVVWGNGILARKEGYKRIKLY